MKSIEQNQSSEINKSLFVLNFSQIDIQLLEWLFQCLFILEILYSMFIYWHIDTFYFCWEINNICCVDLSKIPPRNYSNYLLSVSGSKN